MPTTFQLLQEAKKKNAERFKKIMETNKRRDEERFLFLSMQKAQVQPEKINDILDFEGYNVNSPYIRGEFHLLFEGNLFCFEMSDSLHNLGKTEDDKPENERNLILISGKSQLA